MSDKSKQIKTNKDEYPEVKNWGAGCHSPEDDCPQCNPNARGR